jgi:DedD protein
MTDEGFHEIQLGKKQLFFVFMTATVLFVVVFLIGVWVGRDVRRVDSEIVADVPAADVTPDTPQPPTQVEPKELDYAARLQTVETKPAEPPPPVAESAPPEPADPKPADPKTTAMPPPAAEKSATPASKPEKGAATSAPSATKPAPQADGWFVQVGAFGTSGPADTLMTSLKKKNYAAYIVTEPTGPAPFKVRVGPFAERAAADAASARLKKEEGLSPLVRR